MGRETRATARVPVGSRPAQAGLFFLRFAARDHLHRARPPLRRPRPPLHRDATTSPPRRPHVGAPAGAKAAAKFPTTPPLHRPIRGCRRSYIPPRPRSIPVARDPTSAARDHLPSARDHLSTARDHLSTARDHLPAARDHLSTARDHLSATRDHLSAARDHVSAATPPCRSAGRRESSGEIPDHAATPPPNSRLPPLLHPTPTAINSCRPRPHLRHTRPPPPPATTSAARDHLSTARDHLSAATPPCRSAGRRESGGEITSGAGRTRSGATSPPGSPLRPDAAG